MATPADGIPADELKLLASWYQDFGDALRDRVLNPRGGKDSSRAWNQADAAQRLGQVRSLARSLDVRIAGTMGKRFTELAREARAKADRQAIEAGVRPDHGAVAGSFQLVDSKALSVVARDTLADLRKASGGAVAKAESVLRATADNGLTQTEINDIIAGRLISGDRSAAIQQLAGQLRAIHEGKVMVLQTKGGPREYDIAKYAEMVIRTKTRQATVIARHERFSELGIDLVIITGRISNNFCTAYVNQIFSISGKDERYPPLSSLPGGGPPFHPNCSKSTRAHVEEFADDRELEALAESPDLSPMLNTSPEAAQRTYRDLQLRQQATARTEKLSPLGAERSAAAGLGAVEAQARRLGVGAVNLSEAPNTGRRVVNALESAQRAGAPMPKELQVSASAFVGNEGAAATTTLDGRVLINPRHPAWVSPGDFAKEMARSGEFPADDPNFVSYHELGHVAMQKLDLARYERLYDAKFDSHDDALSALTLSRYAGKAPLEFIAEAYAMKLAGKPLPSEAAGLYVKLGGPR